MMSCFEHSSAFHVQFQAVISTRIDNIQFDHYASAKKPPNSKNDERSHKHLDCTSIIFNFQSLRINKLSKYTSCTMNTITCVICGIQEEQRSGLQTYHTIFPEINLFCTKSETIPEPILASVLSHYIHLRPDNRSLSPAKANYNYQQCSRQETQKVGRQGSKLVPSTGPQTGTTDEHLRTNRAAKQ